MTREQLKEALREVILKEMSTTSAGGAGFTPGEGMTYATPAAFSKRAGKNRAVKFLEKLGYKQVERPKRPSNTKTADFV